MKLYLDENLPPKLRYHFNKSKLNIFSFQYLGWKGKKNGELLKLLIENEFNGLITADKLMYTDAQIKQSKIQFYLIQSIGISFNKRLPLIILLNQYILDNYDELSKVTSTKIIVSQGSPFGFFPGINRIW